MDNRGQQEAPQQGAAAPQYSSDGRWYWDGSAWQPVVHQAAVLSPRRRWRPGRKLYLVPVLALGLAALLVTLVVRGFVTGFPMNATRVTGPGTHEITLTAPGTYTISYERHATGNVGGGFQMGGEPLGDLPAGTLKLVSSSGEAIDLRRPSTIFTYSAGNTEGEAIAEFELDHPGTYAFTSALSSGDSRSQFTLAIARGSPSDTIGYLLGGLAAFALLFIGIGIAIATLVLRRVRRQPA